MSGYVFLSNSTKPLKTEQNSRAEIQLTNVSRPCLQVALGMGYEVYFGVNRADPEDLKCELPVKMYDSHTYRSITSFFDNYIAYKNLASIVKNRKIEVIHCNTPVGGLIGRVVGKRYHVDKIIYTVHGVHFFKGAPFINRTLYKWAEQIMAHWTDAIITMNEEDFESARAFRLRKGGKIYKVHGVGISLDRYKNVQVDRDVQRAGLGLNSDDIVCISAGDLVPRKNYKAAIEALAKVECNKLHYLICGVGSEKEILEKYACEKGVANQVHFLGYRADIIELLKCSDIFLFSTLQEGLPRSMMEAMACGLPCIASKIRGNVDLIEDGKGGFLCNPKDIDAFACAIKKLTDSQELRVKMGKNNLNVIKGFDISVVKEEIETIYREILLSHETKSKK